MRVFVWIFCTSDLVWVDPVFVDCQRSCICGLSGILYLWIVTDPVFVDRHLDLLTIKICWRGWVVPLPPLVSDPSDCRDVCPFVTPAPKFPSRQARCPKMSTMWTKSAQNRLGHAAVAQCFDWLPDILALFMGKGEGLSIWLASRSSLKKLNWPNYSESATKPAVNEEESGASEVLPCLTNIEEPSLSDTYLYFAVKLIVYVMCPTSHWSFELYETEIFICIRKSKVSSILLAQVKWFEIWIWNMKLSWNIDLNSMMSLHLIVIGQKTCMPVPIPLH